MVTSHFLLYPTTTHTRTVYSYLNTSMMEPLPHDIELGAQMDTRPQNLYEEAHAMLLNAFLMFCIPDVRALARQGLLEGDAERIQRIIDLPASIDDIVTVYEENFELLTKTLKSEERSQMYKVSS